MTAPKSPRYLSSVWSFLLLYAVVTVVGCSTRDADPVREGTTYVDRTRLGPVHGEVVALERPTRVVFHYTAHLFGTTVMEGWPGYELERVGDASTRVHHVATGRPRSFFRLVRPLVQRLAQNERQRTVDAIKQSFASDARQPN